MVSGTFHLLMEICVIKVQIFEPQLQTDKKKCVFVLNTAPHRCAIWERNLGSIFWQKHFKRIL